MLKKVAGNATIVVAWMAAGLVSLVLLWWVLVAFSNPDCVAYDGRLQNFFRVAAAMLVVVTGWAWVFAVRRMRGPLRRRVQAAVALPLFIVGAMFVTGLAFEGYQRIIDASDDAAACM